MSDNAQTLTDRRLTTPRAAAVAGILFSVLLSAAYILNRTSIPADPADGGTWLEGQAVACSGRHGGEK